MFNLQGSELIIILLLALVVLGPEKLPDAMRKAGQFYAELKKMSTGFQSEFRAAVEEPLRELRETANTIRDSADFTKLQDGGRAEKPKSAEMEAADDPDPDAVTSSDLPFRPDGADEASSDPVAEPPGDVAPGDQEPFASVVLTNRAIDRSTDPTDRSTDPADPDDATDPDDAPATETLAPAAFSGHQVSSAGPPLRVSAPVDPPSVADAPTDPNPSDEAANDDPVKHSGDTVDTEPNPSDEAANDDPVEHSGDTVDTEPSPAAEAGTDDEVQRSGDTAGSESSE